MGTQPPAGVRFGVFEIDPLTGEVRKAGRKIRIQEQPFRVLGVLLEHPGQVVTREDLRQRLWPEDTFVDFDHSLNTAINKLREALGDGAESPRYVETVPKTGVSLHRAGASNWGKSSLRRRKRQRPRRGSAGTNRASASSSLWRERWRPPV